MGSGRDYMLERWTQEEKKQFVPVKTPLERLKEYRETVIENLERVEYHIKEYEDEQKKTI